MKNKTTAALLALFLGGFGVHRFYLGENGPGILYLIFCWTFIPAIIAFFEFIIFLSMDEDKFNAKYNQGVILNGSGNINVADELEKLNSLKVKGIITQADFDRRKLKLL
jgi:TM2 domain-containing membrane protein YozV